MNSRIRSAVLAVALTTVAAAPAAALIPCQDCESPDNTRCAAICDGQMVRFCSDWFFLGCNQLVVLLPQAMAEEETEWDSEEQFLRSLEAEAVPEPAGCE